MAGAKPIKAETYKIELLPDSDEEQSKPVPPVANMTSATDLITRLLEQNSIQYAVMGGFAIHLLERPRETRDIDVCFIGGFKHIRAILEQQPRLVIPSTKLASDVMKVFVKTGPGQDSCSHSHNIEIKLIESGVLGSPADLASHCRPITLSNGKGQQRTIQTLDILYLLRSKMNAYRTRQSESDRTDILHLLKMFEDEARSASGNLDPEDVAFFVESSPQEDQKSLGGLLGVKDG